MGDPGAVQLVYFGPQLLEDVIRDLLRGKLIERAARYPVHDQQRGPASRLDHPIDAGDADVGPFGQVPEVGLPWR